MGCVWPPGVHGAAVRRRAAVAFRQAVTCRLCPVRLVSQEAPHLDGELAVVLGAGHQQDVAGGQVAVQDVVCVQVRHPGSDLARRRGDRRKVCL